MLLPIFTPCANRGIEGDTMDRAKQYIATLVSATLLPAVFGELRLHTRKPTAALMIFLEPCLAFTSSLPSQPASGPCRPAITAIPDSVRWTDQYANVQNLHITTTMSTGIPHGHEGQPLVVNNTLYIVTPFPNNLIALISRNPAFRRSGFFILSPTIALSALPAATW